MQWHINDSNQFELEPSGRTAPVTDLTTVTPVNIYDPNRPDRGPNQNDADLVAANTWAGEPQFQVARYGKDLYIVDFDRMGLIPYRQWTKARAEHPYAMAIPGFIGDVLAGGPSRMGEEAVVGLALGGMVRAGGATWATLRGMVGASAEARTVTFYTVQSTEDAARLARGGDPWPTTPERAHFGEGVYAWQTEEAAATYRSRLAASGANDLQVVKVEIDASRLEGASILDMRGMGDDEAERIMSQHSKLWNDAATDLPYDVAIRPVNPDLGSEVYLSSRLFRR